MTPELVAAIIACLGAIAAWFKARTDVKTIREERTTTKSERDKEAQELRDKVLRLEFQGSTQKGLIEHLSNRQEDLNQQINTLNTQLSTMLIKMDNVIETLKELKGGFKNV